MCIRWDFKSDSFMYYSTTFFGLQPVGGSANMFYTCGPNEAMVVSGNMIFLQNTVP